MEYNIASFQKNIKDNNKQLSDLREKISRYTNLYESLRVFKRTVENSQKNFESINASKKRMLIEVASVRRNNKAASNYFVGINDILNGTGTQIVSVAYRGLLRQIADKLFEYKREIDNCQKQIDICQQNITDLGNQFKEQIRHIKEARNDG